MPKELIERIKRHQEEHTKLYELGVIGVSDNKKHAIHLSLKLFIKLFGGNFAFKARDCAEYPAEIYAYLDDIRVFAILKEGELNE